MPTLFLENISTPEGRFWANIKLKAVTAWPSNKEKRNQYLAAVLNNINGMPESISFLSDRLDRYLQNWLTERGSAELLKAFSDTERITKFNESGLQERWLTFEIGREPRVVDWIPETVMEDAYVAGAVMWLVWSMSIHHTKELQGGGSISKAIHVLAHTSSSDILLRPRFGQKPALKQERRLREAWASHQSVAHLCAALLSMRSGFIKDGNASNSETLSALHLEKAFEFFKSSMLEDFLDIALACQQFGLSFQNIRTKSGTLLRPQETWLLPEHGAWDSWLVEPPKPKPLSPEILNILSKYRAQKRN